MCVSFFFQQGLNIWRRRQVHGPPHQPWQRAARQYSSQDCRVQCKTTDSIFCKEKYKFWWWAAVWLRRTETWSYLRKSIFEVIGSLCCRHTATHHPNLYLFFLQKNTFSGIIFLKQLISLLLIYYEFKIMLVCEYIIYSFIVMFSTFSTFVFVISFISGLTNLTVHLVSKWKETLERPVLLSFRLFHLIVQSWDVQCTRWCNPALHLWSQLLLSCFLHQSSWSIPHIFQWFVLM